MEEGSLPQTGETPFAGWIGRQTRAHDVVTERLDASFRAVLAPHLAPVGEGEVPPGLHWCLSPAVAPMAELGGDGHPARNRDLPPVPQPRRMWAGGVVETLDSLRVGDSVVRVSTIAGISRKHGRSGELWFVAIDHEFSTPRGLAVRDRQNIVYREAANPAGDRSGANDAPRPSGRRVWSVATSPVLLFRYSAITFNGHRIHYDDPYARNEEGYGGLVVHGPLQATLLLNLATAEEGRVPRRFSYRGLAPAIVGAELGVCRGDGAAAGTYWTEGAAGVFMEARVDGT